MDFYIHRKFFYGLEKSIAGKIYDTGFYNFLGMKPKA